MYRTSCLSWLDRARILISGLVLVAAHQTLG